MSIGDTTTRFGSVSPRSRNGVNIGGGAPSSLSLPRDAAGAPPWAAYALLGLAIDELGLSPNEARHLLGLADAADPQSGEE
jgi:hypothetical protein